MPIYYENSTGYPVHEPTIEQYITSDGLPRISVNSAKKARAERSREETAIRQTRLDYYRELAASKLDLFTREQNR
jgi:hypothetical protein